MGGKYELSVGKPDLIQNQDFGTGKIQGEFYENVGISKRIFLASRGVITRKLFGEIMFNFFNWELDRVVRDGVKAGAVDAFTNC